MTEQVGSAELRTGAWMMRGTIIALRPIEILPTFSYASRYNPSFLNVYARHLKALGVELPHIAADGAYHRYTGDVAIPGRGELLVWEAGTS
jgi:formylmethanofuran dehydrogenase subunit C